MATVNFKPIQDISGYRFDRAVEVRQQEMEDLKTVISLLELGLVDFSLFARKITPVVTLAVHNFKQHRDAVAAVNNIFDTRETDPILTAMTMDLEELRAVIIRAAQEDPTR